MNVSQPPIGQPPQGPVPQGEPAPAQRPHGQPHGQATQWQLPHGHAPQGAASPQAPVQNGSVPHGPTNEGPAREYDGPRDQRPGVPGAAGDPGQGYQGIPSPVSNRPGNGPHFVPPPLPNPHADVRANPFAAPGASGIPPTPGQPGFGQPGFVAAAPQRSREQVVSIMLAGVGALVTLIGVALVVMMAAREGLLTPPVRIGGGVLLAIGLAVAAGWVRPRPGGRVGSVALLGTSAAAFYFIAYAITQIYEWVPEIAGTLLALGLGLAVGQLALIWRERWLFSALCLGFGFMTVPMLGEVNGLLITFLVVLQVAGALPQLRTGWAELALVRTLPAAFLVLVWVPQEPSALGPVTHLVAAFAVAAIGLMSTFVTEQIQGRGEPAASGALAVALLPVIVSLTFHTHGLPRTLGALLVAGCCFAFALAAVRACRASRTIAGVYAALALVIALWTVEIDGFMVAAFAVLSAGLSVTQLVTEEPRRAWALGGAFALMAALWARADVIAPLDLFYRSRMAQVELTQVFASILILAAAVVGVLASRGPGELAHRHFTAAVAGIAGLYALIEMTLVLLSQSKDGFFIGHLIVTVLVLVVAFLVLVTGLRRPQHLGVSLVWGLLLICEALLKLLLFDLQYMGLLTRAMAFVLAGLVLMFSGTRYARVYAETKKSSGAVGEGMR